METAIYTPEQHPEVVVVEVHGQVDCGECGTDRLCDLLHNLVDTGDRFMVVDLSGASAVHERAMAELMAVLGRLRLRGGDMIVVATPGDQLSSLNAMGFGDLTLVLDDLETAIQQAGVKAGELQ